MEGRNAAVHTAIALCALLALSVTPGMAQGVPFSVQSYRLPLPSPNSGNHGVSVIDYDGDGRDDIFLANVNTASDGDTTSCRLLRNLGGAVFADRTVSAGLRTYGGFKTGIWGDVNRDGLPDLFLGESYRYGRSHLYLNDGDGTFTDVTASGIDLNLPVATATFGDYDGDGRLDLFLATESPEFDVLYRNTSSGDSVSFADVTGTAGVGGFSNTTAMQATFHDYDRDGDPDIYAVHDGFLPSSLFRNDGNGTFTDVSLETGLYDFGVGNSMGVYWRDFNGDGWDEVYVTRIGTAGIYRRQSDGTYSDIALSTGAWFNGMTWGIVWEDFDNDMDDDLFLVNTFGYNGTKSIYYERFDTAYADRAPQYGLAFPYAFYGLAYGDFDNDGHLDLVASATDGNNMLLMNTRQRTGHWVKMTLAGVTVNTMAVGAEVRFVAGGKSVRRTVTAGNGYASQMAPFVHAGLGHHAVIDTVEVTWKKGSRQVFTAVPADSHYRLTEGGSLHAVTSVPEPVSVPTEFSLGQNHPNPFNPATAVRFTVPNGGAVRLTVFDLLGRTVAVPVNDVRSAGTHVVRIDASSWPSGVFLYRLESGGRSAVRKMVVVK